MIPDIQTAAACVGLAFLVALMLLAANINRDAPPNGRWAGERRREQARWAPRGPGLWGRFKTWLWRRLDR